MPLLVLDGVWKRFARGDRGVRERVALRDVSLEVERGELLAILGHRGSGRTTLLQVAAGIEQPSSGTVRFAGHDLGARPALGALDGIGYCTTTFPRVIGDTVLEQVAAPLLSGNVSMLQAQARAHEALRRVQASACAELEPDELDSTSTIRVAIARALIHRPRLLLVDEPTLGIRLTERDTLLELFRDIADGDGVAVLITVDEATALAGCDRAILIDAGEVRGETLPRSASVVPLRRTRTGSSE